VVFFIYLFVASIAVGLEPYGFCYFLFFFVLSKVTCFAKYLIELLPIKYMQPRYFNKLGCRIHRNI